MAWGWPAGTWRHANHSELHPHSQMSWIQLKSILMKTDFNPINFFSSVWGRAAQPVPAVTWLWGKKILLNINVLVIVTSKPQLCLSNDQERRLSCRKGKWIRLGLFWLYACPARRTPWGRPRTNWWDYISHLSLEQLVFWSSWQYMMVETKLTNNSLIQTHYSFLLLFLRGSFLDWCGNAAMCSSWFTLTNVLAHYSVLSANYIHTL